MPDRIETLPDHVAVAVDDPDRAADWWCEHLGAGLVSRFDNPTFSGRQLRLANGAKLELLAPPVDGGGFVAAFLERFGTRVHHVTLKVADLAAAISAVESAGLDVVDVRDDLDHWKEGFLRPSQVGGLVVQIAETPWSDEDWATARGQDQERPAADGATLLGPTLGHPDLPTAARIWSLLGGRVEEVEDGLAVSWADAPLGLRIVTAPRAGPLALRIDGVDAEAAGIGERPRPGIHPRLRTG